MKIRFKKFSNEMWLEYGYLKFGDYQDVLWYNEGESREFIFWLKKLLKKNNSGKYFIFRWRFFEITITKK